MNRDFAEMLSALSAAGARFLIVGAHALAAHGAPRATGDLDIWIQATSENAARVLTALRAVGAPQIDQNDPDHSAPDTVFQIGLPPARKDIITGISGVGFDEAWDRRITVWVGDLEVPTLGRPDFIANKQAAGRPKDLLDLELLPPV
jgi:hypothetical protein